MRSSLRQFLLIAMAILCVVAGCEGPANRFGYEFEGTIANIRGDEWEPLVSRDARPFSFDPYSYNVTASVLVFYSDFAKCLLILESSSLVAPPGVVTRTVRTDDDSARPWLLRGINPWTCDYWKRQEFLGFLAADQSTRRQNPLAFEMTGSLTASFNDGRLTRLAVDLSTLRPIPMVAGPDAEIWQYGNAYHDHSVPLDWLKERAARPDSRPAVIRGEFVGQWYHTPWYFNMGPPL